MGTTEVAPCLVRPIASGIEFSTRCRDRRLRRVHNEAVLTDETRGQAVLRLLRAHNAHRGTYHPDGFAVGRLTPRGRRWPVDGVVQDAGNPIVVARVTTSSLSAVFMRV